jgi:hypothetical protein
VRTAKTTKRQQTPLTLKVGVNDWILELPNLPTPLVQRSLILLYGNYMVYNYPENTSSCMVQYHRVREGPNWMMVYYKNAATPCLTLKEVKARFGPAKNTEGCKKIFSWCEEQITKYQSSSEELDVDRVAKEGFGPEAHLDESDPNYQTKMVL